MQLSYFIAHQGENIYLKYLSYTLLVQNIDIYPFFFGKNCTLPHINTNKSWTCHITNLDYHIWTLPKFLQKPGLWWVNLSYSHMRLAKDT